MDSQLTVTAFSRKDISFHLVSQEGKSSTSINKRSSEDPNEQSGSVSAFSKKRHVWTSKLEQKLFNAVEKSGKDAWSDVCTRIGLSQEMQLECFNRWMQLSQQFNCASKGESPSVSRGSFSEDINSQAAQQLKNISLQQQYQVQGGQKGTWNEEEDQQLLELVEQHGAKGWNFIASRLPGRAGKQCRERYHNHLDPNIFKEKWTLEEDRNLMQLYQKHGKKWSLIAKHMAGRTDNIIKNRFNSALKMHNTFQDYLNYKQRKYEKSLQRKSKGIYRKRNEDESTLIDKKKIIVKQNELLLLMKSLAANAKTLNVQDGPSVAVSSSESSQVADEESSKNYDSHFGNRNQERNKIQRPKHHQLKTKGLQLIPCEKEQHADQHTSSSSDYMQRSSLNPESLAASNRSSLLPLGSNYSENRASIDLICSEVAHAGNTLGAEVSPRKASDCPVRSRKTTGEQDQVRKTKGSTDLSATPSWNGGVQKVNSSDCSLPKDSNCKRLFATQKADSFKTSGDDKRKRGRPFGARKSSSSREPKRQYVEDLKLSSSSSLFQAPSDACVSFSQHRLRVTAFTGAGVYCVPKVTIGATVPSAEECLRILLN